MKKRCADDAAFLNFYADVCEAEAARRSSQPEFMGWLLAQAEKARLEADEVKKSEDLFAWAGV